VDTTDVVRAALIAGEVRIIATANLVETATLLDLRNLARPIIWIDAAAEPEAIAADLEVQLALIENEVIRAESHDPDIDIVRDDDHR
jgi:hypothetical protein